MTANVVDDLTRQRVLRRFAQGSKRRAVAEVLLGAEDWISRSAVADAAGSTRPEVTEVYRVLKWELQVNVKTRKVPVPFKRGDRETEYRVGEERAMPPRLVVVDGGVAA